MLRSGVDLGEVQYESAIQSAARLPTVVSCAVEGGVAKRRLGPPASRKGREREKGCDSLARSSSSPLRMRIRSALSVTNALVARGGYPLAAGATSAQA